MAGKKKDGENRKCYGFMVTSREPRKKERKKKTDYYGGVIDQCERLSSETN